MLIVLFLWHQFHFVYGNIWVIKSNKSRLESKNRGVFYGKNSYDTSRTLERNC